MSPLSEVPLPLEGVPDRLYQCTPTRLTTWLDCRRRYRFTYLDAPPPPKGAPWAHNSLGASVHGALAGWFRLDEPDRTPEAAGRLLDDGWLRDGFRDDDQSRTWWSRAREMLLRYVSTLDPRAEPVGIERTVGARTRVLAVSGRVDRLDLRRDGRRNRGADGGDSEELVVVDYKTGRRQLTPHDARSSLALALYAFAAGRMLRRRCLRVELHHLPSGEVVGHEHTPESIDRHVVRAEGVAAESSAADRAYRQGMDDAELDRVFPPVVSPACRWCDFVRSCPEGMAAGPPAPSWAGLAEEP